MTTARCATELFCLPALPPTCYTLAMATAHVRACPARRLHSKSLVPAPPHEKLILTERSYRLWYASANPLLMVEIGLISLKLCPHSGSGTPLFSAITQSSGACETSDSASDATRGSSPLRASRVAPRTAETTDARASIARPSPHCAARCAAPDRSSIPRTSDTRPLRSCRLRTRSIPFASRLGFRLCSNRPNVVGRAAVPAASGEFYGNR